MINIFPRQSVSVVDLGQMTSSASHAGRQLRPSRCRIDNKISGHIQQHFQSVDARKLFTVFSSMVNQLVLETTGCTISKSMEAKEKCEI